MIWELATAFVIGLTFGVCAGLRIGSVTAPLDERDEEPSDGLPAMESLDPPVKESIAFAVSGQPRRASWTVRKHELEQQHRNKRKAAQEW